MESDHVPRTVRVINPLVRTLLRFGLRAGPMVLLTVRGRTSGQPRATPVGVFERDGHRWLFAEFGHVDWVRNLRAMPNAELRRGGRRESVVAVELSTREAAAVLRDVVVPWLRSPIGRVAARMADPSLLTHPPDAPVADFLQEAQRYPVFEVMASPAGAANPVGSDFVYSDEDGHETAP
jgi:deazaflavin-dependent oxidoreductase (nitroreductase family)